MTVEVLYVSGSGKVLLDIKDRLNEKDIIPENGKRYSLFFEEIKPREEPEFNSPAQSAAKPTSQI